MNIIFMSFISNEKKSWKTIKGLKYDMDNVSVFHLRKLSQLVKLQENSVEECVFVYIALHIECQFSKNSLFQCYFFSLFLAAEMIWLSHRDSKIVP